MENEKQKKKTLKEKTGGLIKKYVMTGLVVVIPLWLTFSIMKILFKWVSSFAFPVVNYFVVDTYWVHIIARISSFFISIISIIVLGLITNRVFGKSALNSAEKFIKKLPVFGKVHSAAKQFINFIFGNDNVEKFKKIIFVPYPSKGVYSVAFLTGEQSVKGEKYLCAFMPTTPNPTTGFLLLFKEEEVVYTDYTVEQAFQFVISVGVINMRNNKKIKLNE
ncbi:hypothetical protein AGMMS5026_03120 [Endomicrobiia bacterium]|nr:hypothetical protein AGMMS49523_05270 [Endomicrobiia bacterium]GHT13837.1 hypothetical protein AGMMS49571_08320 [Endomicrobiia bacterium]GHT19203.1 hypothetical protein AGMMS49929_02390 [Endomicrobiia bacterium]GHT28551.1 hypothetical protein AGMMS49995_09570 [Endomicrobiia bacterium]GHT30044.1 hypothetical protein AGMMS5026_03120 [Endomicrobiia bacterium]